MIHLDAGTRVENFPQKEVRGATVTIYNPNWSYLIKTLLHKQQTGLEDLRENRKQDFIVLQALNLKVGCQNYKAIWKGFPI